ncbi:hypothetical protein AZI86_10280 [Bdellovibrio bacteriovorus]|uniref:Uncharacterized protein n=1 Tax=Bdellovibrio bacteriovorus TaxID=959 RepID=A0A150WS85_BDEBC|nr:hypothetical protein [Bdellovibrio bacteriovorus]KYG67371.1 hypothetical protein AZI86_10280 [Bdellovibrio bacteriovorus]
MTATIAKILGSILRSMFISIVMLVIALSVITGQFPPDFEKLQKTYSSVQELAQLSNGFHERKNIDAATSTMGSAGSMEEDDIRRLEEINAKRAEIGANLLPHASDNGSASKVTTVAQGKTQEQLEGKIRDLQQDLFRLQERVNRLESQSRGETP